MSLSRTLQCSLVAAALSLGVIGASLPHEASAQAVPSTPVSPTGRTVIAAGFGVAFLNPDIAYVTAGVDLDGGTFTTETAVATKAFVALRSAMKAAKIADADIQPGMFTLETDSSPAVDSQSSGAGAGKENTVHLAQDIRITVRDLTTLNDVLNRISTIAVLKITNVTEDVSQFGAQESQARKAALADAQARATELATSMNGTLGQILSIDESTASEATTIAASGLGGYGFPIGAGSFQVTVNLTVTYQVK